MAVRSEKVTIDKLEKGMYVSSLDRPWIETSYMMQGFYIETDKDIEQLATICKYVYVDMALTEMRNNDNQTPDNGKSVKQHKDQEISPAEESRPVESRQVTEKSHLATEKSSQATAKTLKKNNRRYENKTTFETEFQTANSLYRNITLTASNLFSSIRLGETVNLDTIRTTATAIVDSVVRNPDAFLWLSRLQSRDAHSHNRSIRTSVWSIAFARYLGLEKNEMYNLAIAVLLANLGKAKLPEELLAKEDNLQGDDLKTYQQHVDMTLEILKIMGRTPQPVISIISAHCERYDGTGYPNQLRAGEIPLLAQIAGLVSYYEEITNRRIASNSLDPTRAVEQLYKLRDEKFMAELVEEFICSIGIYPVGSIVQLNSKEIAVIIEQNQSFQLLPRVLVLRDVSGERVNVYKIMDLYAISQKAARPPKIIDTLALGSYGIDAEEINASLNLALTQDGQRDERPGGLRRLLSKLTG